MEYFNNLELRMYKHAVQQSHGETQFDLKVYQLIEGSTGPSQLLDTKRISYSTSGWLVLNVSR